jgi:Bacterial TniB protein
VLRRLGREYDISPALVGEAAVYDHIHLTDEMASRFALAAVPRWRYGEDYLALLDSCRFRFQSGTGALSPNFSVSIGTGT